MNKGVIGITLTQDCAKVGLPLVIDGGVDTNQYLNFGSTGVRSCVLGSEKSGGSAANDSTRTGPRPHSENVAAPNSGLPKSRPQGWDDSLRPIARIFLPLVHCRAAPRVDTRSRGSGHGYYLLLRKFYCQEKEF
jgi:hypothetical protein